MNKEIRYTSAAGPVLIEPKDTDRLWATYVTDGEEFVLEGRWKGLDIKWELIDPLPGGELTANDN